MLNADADFLQDDKFGIGVDIIEIKRFRELDLESNFFNRIFTEQEMDYCSRYSDPFPHLAVIFAAKEATIKAMTRRLSLSMKSIDVFHDENDSPYVSISNLPDIEIILSLAHSSQYAVAIACVIPSIQSANTIVFQKLLNEKVSELLPGT
ncbi:MAG: holo-ACP synthase [Candidatus Thorarchaeota archaeon]|nr:holo-ACP synthase [Candidatus Thorarchaeota archaeon]